MTTTVAAVRRSRSLNSIWMVLRFTAHNMNCVIFCFVLSQEHRVLINMKLSLRYWFHIVQSMSTGDGFRQFSPTDIQHLTSFINAALPQESDDNFFSLFFSNIVKLFCVIDNSRTSQNRHPHTSFNFSANSICWTFSMGGLEK